MERPSRQPIELDLDRHEALRIRWADGVATAVSLRDLRRACPCAECRARREEQERNPMTVIAPVSGEADMIVAVSAELVGNYALKIVWQDGHDTGIYDFSLLRKLGSEVP